MQHARSPLKRTELSGCLFGRALVWGSSACTETVEAATQAPQKHKFTGTKVTSTARSTMHDGRRGLCPTSTQDAPHFRLVAGILVRAAAHTHIFLPPRNVCVCVCVFCPLSAEICVRAHVCTHFLEYMLKMRRAVRVRQKQMEHGCTVLKITPDRNKGTRWSLRVSPLTH